jgi:hypothetical protein
MAHQIVATSVPRGLDGVSGYQTVLKSASIPPRLFDRLKARSGYSHRYPHGDSRNPVIYLHRVEELGGGRWHVLGCIRDAGSDHTGRSNFLAHMLGIDAAEARGKLGGPAAAAMARGCFVEKWDGPPEPAALAKTLVAADRPPQSGDVPAWTAAGLDPGLAGDLAAAAMANRKVVMVTRPGDDVLAMFADALRMVEPSKRWGVTFNTCAIEDFDGVWKAIRSDLADAKDLRDSRAVLIDLTAGARGSADPYARFARGEAESLPWQKRFEPAEPVRQTEAGEPERRPRKENEPGKEYVTKEPTTKRASRAEWRGDRRPPYGDEEPSRVPWDWFMVAGVSLLMVGALVAMIFRDQLFGLGRSTQTKKIVPMTELTIETVKPSSIDARATTEYQRLQQLEEAKSRLAAGVDGKTHDELREDANALLRHIGQLRRGQDGGIPLQLLLDEGAERDPSRAVEQVIAKCNHVAQVLETVGVLRIEDITHAEAELKSAVDELASLKPQIDALAVTERKKLDAKKLAAEAEALRQRQQRAFEELQSLVEAVSLPTAADASGTDLDGPRKVAPGSAETINLGSFVVADLVEPQFRLAVPRDKVVEQEFKAQVVNVGGQNDMRWEIRYVPQGVALEGEKTTAKPRPLAFLVARDGHLVLEVPRSNELWHPPFALLRRSVLLVEAKDPAAPAAPPVVREIRLVKPTKVKPMMFNIFEEDRQEMKIIPPAGIARHSGIPIASLRFEAEFPGGRKESLELPKDARAGTDPGIGEWDLPLAELEPDLAIQAVVKLSLPQATMTVQTKFTGRKASHVDMDTVKRYSLDKPNNVLNNLKRGFTTRVESGKRFNFIEKQTKEGEKEILAWFDKPLAGLQRGGMGLTMAGHETVQKSFTLFLKERYDEAAKGMKPGRQPSLPEKWDEFFTLCSEVKDANDWENVFTNQVSAWADWFWPQFEKQWEENVKLYGQIPREPREIRIIGITSLAYDETGKAYDVPLVIGESARRPNQNHGSGLDGGSGFDGGAGLNSSAVSPPSGAGASGSVGID